MGSVEIGWIFVQTLSAILTWFLLSKLLYLLMMNRSASYCVTWIVLLFCFGPRNSLLSGVDTLIQPLEFSRTPHPALSFLLLTSTVLATLNYLIREKNIWLMVGSVCSGLLTYTYYFYWIPFWGTLGVMGLFFLANRNYREAVKVGRIMLLALIVAIPYGVRVFSGMNSGFQKNLLERVGGFTHQINFPYAYLALFWLMVLSLYGYRVRNNKLKSYTPQNILCLMLLSILFVSSVGLNLHFLTGYDAQHTHFFNRIIQPMMGIVVFYGLSRMVGNKIQPFFRLVLAVFASTLIFMGGYRQWKVANLTFHDHSSSSSLYQTLFWAQKNLSSESVIASSDPAIALLVPAIAGTWNFVPVGDRTMVSKDEILIRYIVASKLEGLSREEALNRMAQRGPSDSKLWLHSIYVFFTQSFFDPSPLKKIEDWWRNTDPKIEIKKRKLNFLIVASNQNPSNELIEDIVFENNGFKILKVRSL